MRAAAFFSALLLTSRIVSGAPDVLITLKNGNTVEAQTEAQLRRLLQRYDLAPWLITPRIEIDFQSIPHSHPVLTLHARHRDQPDLLLSTFIHEELHWWLAGHLEETAAAVADLRRQFPFIAVGGLDGADTEKSSYEHLLVIYLEWQADRRLLGDSKALDVMTFWSTDHYRALYTLVLASGPAVREVVVKRGLDCCAASSKASFQSPLDAQTHS